MEKEQNFTKRNIQEINAWPIPCFCAKPCGTPPERLFPVCRPLPCLFTQESVYWHCKRKRWLLKAYCVQRRHSSN